jgi:hypothetical protein
MRTTLELDDDLLATAREIARTRGASIGRVISDLARRGLSPSVPVLSDGVVFPHFVVPPDAPPITSEAVARALEE